MRDTHDIEIIKESIRTIKDFPSKGVMFRDISTLLSNPAAYSAAVRCIAKAMGGKERYDKIAAAESRGFLFGAPVALNESVPFVMVRKKGKLPGEVVSLQYSLEYGTDTIEVTSDSFKPGDRVVVFDDLVATGGTICAMCQLIEKCGASVTKVVSLIDLPALGGSSRIKEKYDFESVVEF
ncbi:MAG: adenine phosphoribosyltransferase [Bacteroidales bacterium]|nr:adenine phosphoribosyltransferase [Bacteroidales bacterium]